MALTVTPLTPNLGAEISGVDLSVPLSNSDFDTVHQAFVDHSLLVFRGQDLSPKAQVAFSQRFGPLMIHVLKEALIEDQPEIYKISNLTEDGKPVGRAYAGQYWHSDLTYEPQPSLGSLLYGVQVPEVGGDTLFASTAHAYETLSPAMQGFLEGLTAEHHFAHAFRERPKAKTGSPNHLEERPPVVHPVVRTHPESGRKCLFLNEGFTVRIKELAPAENKAVMQFLFDHMTRAQSVLRHHWQDGDAVLWDNRALVHRGVDDYGDDSPRHMHRTTIEDTAEY
ncbi:MAG: TauD/TfdA family dioxygenase [Rhodospirillaceae bacterium]|mgnify:CR=1 FL=1|jgi:taurine dioxygenase|nr:TauD/TfdA family dioxygenase [Rhodospirillaceae bacterium]MBT6139110.1 TauD/TfdA family dioxygenase [Rhodospirillaceae bacterium]